MNRYFVALLIVFFASAASAQQNAKRPDYKLLWKISGKGLKTASYLFGTMHVQDNRAFDFSDSVLLKISECQAFALEVHPDSITSLVLSVILMDRTHAKSKFREMLTPAEFKRLDSLMKKKAGYSLDKFKSPAVAQYFLFDKAVRKDKRTFLDAWLYKIAREQGKIMVGLEDGRTQFEALDTDPSEQIRNITEYLTLADGQLKNPYEDFLDVYYRGNIDEIRARSLASFSTDRYEQLITIRNLGMVANIEKEIHRHSTFIAVGAAHLAGEEGIVHLLRTHGYTVTPVPATFTGLAKKYKYEPAAENWFQYSSDDGAYSIEMPQRPLAFRPDTIPLTFQTYFDIGTPAIYMSTHLP
ncbi:MAG TPA: TraB/GumN family protein, partial [Ohtaekwangia sp.]|nr:TraB/GumN family protein [Ohtaekwangia sp.]